MFHFATFQLPGFFDVPVDYPKRLNPFFFSGFAGIPHAVRAISCIARAIIESSMASGVASFCMRRTVT
jgi:hypothetical protein